MSNKISEVINLDLLSPKPHSSEKVSASRYSEVQLSGWTVSSDFTVFSPKNLVEILLNDLNHSSFAASSLAGPSIFELVII
jgi:hypothetical protein